MSTPIRPEEEMLRIWLQGRVMCSQEMIDWIILLVRERDVNAQAADHLWQANHEIERLIRKLNRRDTEIHVLKQALQAAELKIGRLQGNRPEPKLPFFARRPR